MTASPHRTKNKWLWLAALAAIVLAVSRGAVIPAVGRLLRFLMPVALVYLAYKFTMRAFFPKIDDAPRYIPHPDDPLAPTIVICPKCGNEKTRGHHC